jgi:hypothetical protein
MYRQFGGACRTYVYVCPVSRTGKQLSPDYSILSRFPLLTVIDTTCKTEYSDVRFVTMHCTNSLGRLWPTGEVSNNFVSYQISVWSQLMVKYRVGYESVSVTTGCYLNIGVEMLLCAFNQWIGWPVWQALINISWLYDELLSYLVIWVLTLFVWLHLDWLIGLGILIVCWLC